MVKAMAKIKVLLVDDEVTILKVVQMAMRATIECDVVTATSGEQALRIMEKEHFDAVVSDIKMPGMDGATLVNVVAELYPNTMRLIFTSRATGDVGLRTAGAAHQFYLKPTDITLIAERIKRIHRLRSYLPAEGMDRIVAKIRSLPSLPAVFTELEQELKKPQASMEAVGRILEKDIAMSAKVLQLVNSAFFGMRERVNKPSQAAVLLGGQVMKALLLGLHIFTEWTRQTIPCFSVQELWGHGLNVAAGAQALALAEGCTREQADEFYAAGLFHDIGKIVIADNLPESCEQIQKMVQARGISIAQAEREILGATHAEVGAYLMALWGFPDGIVNACAFHHQPSGFETPGFNTVSAVHVANVLDHKNSLHGTKGTEVLDMDYVTREGFGGKVDVWRQVIANLAQG